MAVAPQAPAQHWLQPLRVGRCTTAQAETGRAIGIKPDDLCTSLTGHWRHADAVGPRIVEEVVDPFTIRT